MSALPLKVSHDYRDPMLVRVTIQNLTDFNIPIGDDGDYPGGNAAGEIEVKSGGPDVAPGNASLVGGVLTCSNDAPRIGPGYYTEISVANGKCLILDPTVRHTSVVDDPARALAAIGTALRPGGVLSLLVNQRHAAVVARAMAGHFGQARDLLDAAPGTAPNHPRRFTVDELAALLDRAGFEPTATHAVRVFVDLVPSSLVDLEPGAADRLVELELAVAERPEYLALATQVHTLATRR